MWLPVGAIGTWLTAAGCIGAAGLLARRGRWNLAVVCVLAAALLIRIYAAADRALHPWDERYHALVAKHLIAHPFTPTLYDDPVLPYDPRNWTSNHVWLHKPPLALWMQALSMKLLGVNEIAMRLPSIIGSTLAVGATFAIGRRLFTPAVGLVAATFHAFSGFLVDLAAGRRPGDHVDTLLLLIVSGGIAAALVASRIRDGTAALPLGVATGVACMTKAVSGLMILPIWGAYRLMSRGAAQSAKELLAAGLIGAAIVLPWSLHTHRSFPAESAHELRYALRHVTEPLENQGGPPWQYLAEMPRVYGELIVIPIAWAVVTSFAGGASRSRRAALVWAAIPYLLFSMFATKMPAYVIAAAPAIFLLSAEFWLTLKQRYHGSTAALPKLVMGAGLAVFALLPTRYLVEPHGPLERRDRNPQWARDLRALNDQIGPQKAVVFNARHAVEAMFYTPYVFYAHVPTQNEIDGLTSRGYAVFFYHDGAQPPPAALPRGVAIVGPARRPAP